MNASTRRRFLVAGALLVLAPVLVPASAGGEVPASVRVIRGARKGPAHVDPKLDDLRRQLSALAYQRWEQVRVEKLDFARGKTRFVELPGGETVGLTLEERRGEVVTFEVSLTSRNTQSRLTVEKGQRIVHQVTPEKGGEAVFVTVQAWP